MASEDGPRFRRYDEIDRDYLLRDRHVHSTYSDGTATVGEIAARALELELVEVAVVDHVRRDSGYVADYVREVRDVSASTGLPMLAGIETKVADQAGSLDVSAPQVEAADLVVASVHRFPLGGRLVYPSELAAEECREVEYRLTMAALESGGFDVMGHPGGMSMRATGAFPLRWYADIIRACADSGVAFELNAAYHAGVESALAPHLVERGCPVSLGSDAHDVGTIGAWLALWPAGGEA